MKNKGFTLIELLAVVVILGIIALVAIPAVNNMITNNRIEIFYDIAESAVDALKYEMNTEIGLSVSEGDTYTKKISELNMQKESTRSPFDSKWVDDKCVVTATRIGNDFNYSISLIDEKGNCINTDYYHIREQAVVNTDCGL